MKDFKSMSKRILLKDGISLSVQASEFHYSTPRNDEGPYFAVEVGYIEDATGESVSPPETWKEYADGEFPNAVYGYVPIKMVQDFCDEHGGILINP